MNIFRRQSIALGLTLTLISLLGLTACGGGSTSSGADGGIIATGRALVNGNVASSTLPGDLSNIEVTILNRTTQTNSAGEFSLDDVEAGAQKLLFKKGGETASLALSIPSQSQTTLSNIHIDSNTVSTESVEVEDHSTEKEVEKPEEEEEDQHSTEEQDTEEDGSENDNEDQEDQDNEDDQEDDQEDDHEDEDEDEDNHDEK